MAKSAIIIDGAGVTAKFNDVSIADIVSISFGVHGERDEIDLSTIDATEYMVGLLGDLVGVEDVVITKKADPAAELAHTSDNKNLVIEYYVGKSTKKTLTYWAQLKNVSPSSVERAAADGVNVDMTFAITNLNADLAETGPSIA